MNNKLDLYQVQLHKIGEMEVSFDVTETIGTPCKSAEIIYDLLKFQDRENFVVLMVNTKYKVIGINTAHVGSLNSSVVHPREVFKPAILSNAAGVFLAHNHPSGDPTPSREDIEVTRRFIDAGSLLGVEVVDHIIVGNMEGFTYYSFKEKMGWMFD